MPPGAVPVFPTPVAIFTGANAAQVGKNPRVVVNGQVAYMWQGNYPDTNDGFQYGSRRALLFLPAGTDIRGMEGTTDVDYVQIPSGTGNWYLVSTVIPRWMGFPGSHLVCHVLAHQFILPRDSPLGFPCTVPGVPTTGRPPFTP